MSRTIECEELLKQPDHCLSIAQDIYKKHNRSVDCVKIGHELQFVFVTTDHAVVKIFPPQDTDFFETEALFLTQLYQQLPIQTPQLYTADFLGPYPSMVGHREYDFCAVGLFLTQGNPSHLQLTSLEQLEDYWFGL